MLSNIHTIRAHIVGKDERTWNFDDEFSDNVSILDFSEFFVRCESDKEKSNLGILFELSIHCLIKV